MKRRLQRFLEMRCRVAPGTAILVGLSGGGDSVALLHLLVELRQTFPLVLRAAHLDHAIRRESVADARWVEELCRELRVPLEANRKNIPGLAAARRENLEAVAREVRHAWLLEVADQTGCELVALAHQRDDQAETVLQRLLRGSGSRGLGGMAWRRDRLIRPLLGFSRSELRGYLQARQLTWREDASNDDPTLTRSRLRHQLLPLLEEYNPRVVDGLNELAEQLRAEETFWDDLVAGELSRLGTRAKGQISFEVKALLELPQALRLRLLRGAMAELREARLRGIEAKHLRAIEGLLTGAGPQASLDLPGFWAGRRYQRLLLRHSAPERMVQPPLILDRPGSYPLADGTRLLVELTAASGRESDRRVEFAAGQVSLPLQLRMVEPGDRFVPSGMLGRKKLKNYFIDARIDRETRQRTLVVEGGEVLWLVGLRRCEGYRPARAGEPVVRLSLETSENQTIRL